MPGLHSPASTAKARGEMQGPFSALILDAQAPVSTPGQSTLSTLSWSLHAQKCLNWSAFEHLAWRHTTQALQFRWVWQRQAPHRQSPSITYCLTWQMSDVVG